MKKLVTILIVFLSVCQSYGQLSADFIASPVRGCSPLVVEFTDQSTGAVKYDWDMGNGNRSTLRNPSAIYYKPGLYKVTLTIEDASGNKASKSINTIRVLANPVAKFTHSKSQICRGQELSFRSRSTEGDTTIITSSWDYGDGSTGVGETSEHVYRSNGKFTISLYVKDANGCSDDTTVKDAITILQPPRARFTVDQTDFCSTPAILDITNNSFGQNPQTQRWLVDDSEVSTDRNPSIQISSFGSYKLTLEVTGQNGCKDTVDLSDQIVIDSLQADFQFPDKICGPDLVQFTGKVSPDGMGQMSYRWYVDGVLTADSLIPQLTLTPGNHTVSFVAYTPSCYDSVAYPIIVDTLPSGNFNVTPGVLCNVPTTVDLIYSNNDFDDLTWKVNGSAVSTDSLASYVCRTQRDYRVTLEVGKGECARFFDTTVIFSKPDFESLTDDEGCIPLPVDFLVTNRSKYKIAKVNWDFGDSTFGTGRSPSHTYSDTGEFRVKVTVTDENGCELTKFHTVTAGLRIPPSLMVDTNAVCNGDTVIFENTTNETPVRPHWYFFVIGDSIKEKPNNANLSYPFHQMPGDKSIMLISDHFGCQDSFEFPFTINVKGPFSWIQLRGERCAPVDAEFIDISGAATSRTWLNFPVEGEKDSIVYRTLDSGKYVVGLATYNDTTGCRDTSYLVSTFGLRPELSLELTGNPNCPPVTSQLAVQTKRGNKLKLWVDGGYEEIQLTGDDDIRKTFEKLPSDFKVEAQVIGADGCATDSTIVIDGLGPTANSVVSVSGTCFPYELTLKDLTFGTDTFAHVWIINGDSFPVTNTTMYRNLEVKQFGIDTAEIILSVRSDTCRDDAYFYFPVDSRDVRFDLDTNELCKEIEYSLIARKSGKFVGDMEYNWGVNTDFQNGFTDQNRFSYTSPLDGTEDTVNLKVRFIDGCVTQFDQQFMKPFVELKADFTVDTTGSPCPPLFVNMIDKSTVTNRTIKSWEWDLGDGSTSVWKNPGKMYLEPGSFDLKLKITDEKGCSDSAFYPDLVLVNGPKAQRDVFPKLGCFPHTANFASSSDESVTFKWDLGDGNILLRDTFKHTYTDPGTFIPLLTVSDTNGCSYTLPPRDTIRVVDYPRGVLLVKDSCAESHVTVNFEGTDGGAPIESFIWKFNIGKEVVNKKPFLTRMFSDGGDYTINVVVTNAGGCSIELDTTFKLYDGEPQFKTNLKGVCFNEEINFTDISIADTTLVSRRWFIRDSLLPSTAREVPFAYPTPGIYPVTIEVTDILGCVFSRTDSTGLVVGDTSPLDQAVMKRITVIDDQSVEVKIKPEDDLLLREHSVWLQDPANGGVFMNLGKFGSLDSTYEVGDLNTLDNVYCMMVKRETHCPTPEPLPNAFVHCTVELDAQGVGTENHLDWTPYIGWDSVRNYKIFVREDPTKKFRFLDSVPGSQLIYVDTSFVCKTLKHYRIEALEHEGFYENSWSDTAQAIPEESYPIGPPEVWRATVVDDAYTRIEWLPPFDAKAGMAEYEVFKLDPSGTFQPIGTTSGVNQFLEDQDVKVDDLSYLYRVKATDTCGSISPLSSHGKTVLLEVGFDNETLTPTLKWSKYSFWNEGVEKYIIERYTGEGFEVIGQSLGPDDTTFMDGTGYEQCAPSFCYRVTAIRNQPDKFPDSTHNVISHSNVDCTTVESHLYAPNAFTMNGDGLNETYQPRGMFLKQYHLQVYNRWGQLLYETHDCLGGWDGTYQGVKSPSGTYLVVIDAIGADGIVHTHHGFVHLLE